MTIGKSVYRLHTVDDSMKWARSHIDDAPDGSVFLADVLTQAKGRSTRTWSLYPGQLIVTMLLKPSILSLVAPDDVAIRINQLAMAIGLGILTPLKPYGARLKWPNDFSINDKKLGGMLMHLVWHGSTPRGIVIGFALNINHVFQADDPLVNTAISLQMVTGAECNRRALYKEMLVSLNGWYQCWQQQQWMEIYKQWKEEQAYLGRTITVHQKDGTCVQGNAHQVMPNGDLVLTDDRKKQSIVSLYQVEDVYL